MYNIRKSILGDFQVYRSTTYKISAFTRLLFNITHLVLRKEKDILTEMLLSEKLGENKAEKLSKYDFDELLITMVKQYGILQNQIGVTNVKVKLAESKKINELKSVYHERYISNKLMNISFRISKEDKEEIVNLKQLRLGEVLELAIMLFIHELDDSTYELVLSTLKYDKFK